jgi:carbon-monoxide dehydrogenase medium subunit
MSGWKNYHSPASVDEALDLLTRYAGHAQIVAGGTDLLLEIEHGNHAPVDALIDVTRIPELRGVQTTGNGIVRIGAAATHSEIVRSAVMSTRATCLVESCGVVGGPQVRNVATLGGNVAHALPAADGTVSLVALDAKVEIVKDGERRRVPIRDLFKGPGQSLLDHTRDLLISFEVMLCREGEGTAFKRIMRPQGVALPVLGCAIWVRLRDRRVIEDARVCVAPVAPTPIRLVEAEAALRGLPVSGAEALEETLDSAVKALPGADHPRTSKYRATAEYRVEMADVLLQGALAMAIRRARTESRSRKGGAIGKRCYVKLNSHCQRNPARAGCP